MELIKKIFGWVLIGLSITLFLFTLKASTIGILCNGCECYHVVDGGTEFGGVVIATFLLVFGLNRIEYI